MDILAIETSCDETAAAVVRDGRVVLSSVVHTQVAEHAEYGGVVPEIASRRHVEQIVPVTERALRDANKTFSTVDAVAVTAAPGLIGALLVGVNYAKAAALAARKPLIPVHHIRGHIAANYLACPDLEPPFLALVVSGGHSVVAEVRDYTGIRVLGSTRDDAAGEAFDKAARAMGLPYPGGVSIDRIAPEGDPDRYPLPTPKLSGEFDFSFSGIKTAVVNLLHNAQQRGERVEPADLAAALSEKIAEILCGSAVRAAERTGLRTIAAAGGVSANRTLRRRLREECGKRGFRLVLPPLEWCGDNAAMIGSQAYYQYRKRFLADGSLNGSATMLLSEEFV